MIALMLLSMLVGTVVLIWTFVLEILTHRQRNELRQLVLAERNRNRFGVIRTDLMALARDRQSPIHGPHFRLLYTSLSILMRNPREYERAAQAVLTAKPSERAHSHPFTEQEKRIYLRFAQDLDALCRDFSLSYRCVTALVEMFSGGKLPVPFWVIMQWSKTERGRRTTDVIQARQEIRLAVGANALPA